MLKLIFSVLLMCSLSMSAGATATNSKPLSLDQLLMQVKQGQSNDQAADKQRIDHFLKAKQQQSSLLKSIKQEKKSLEENSSRLETEFDSNQAKVEELQTQLDERLGTMKELFGVLQQVSTETQSQFSHSLTQLQFPKRTQFLGQFANKMSKTTQLPDIADIEHLWFELLREATESGRVVSFPGKKVTAEGKLEDAQITRIGLFNLVSNNTYLQFIPETNRATELQRQPSGRYLDSINGLGSSSSFQAENNAAKLVAIDPTRGQLLSMLIQLPNWQERLRQGGYIGWAIVLLGMIALILTIERFISLSRTSAQVNKQIECTEPNSNNPLGRLLKTHCDFGDKSLETLELKLGERILKELPVLNKRLLTLKVITVIAPLMGLLGTVTGMIFTFQSITLFGTGDPKLMAGGISQALITTVLGLAVAIPGLLMHSLVSSRAKGISQVLEEQAAGMIAERALQS